MKRLLFPIAFALIAATFLPSCKRDHSLENEKKPLTLARIWFNRQFDASLSVTNGELTGGNKYPVWEYATLYSYGGLQVIDVPLVFKKRAVYAAQNANGNTGGKADASLTKLLIVRNSAGAYKEAVIDIIPDKDFYATGYDISKISLNNIPQTFNGYVLSRNWQGKSVLGYHFDNGRAVKKLLPPGTKTGGPGPGINASVAQISFAMFCFDCDWQLNTGDNIMSPQCQNMSLDCGLDTWDTDYSDPCSTNFVNIFGCPCQDGIIDYDHCGFYGGGDGGGYQPPYQLTAQDIAIFAQIDQEDAVSDSIYNNNSPCQGTKASGNINFSGTLEHWLIQLDYLSMYPTFAEREYTIPGSSPVGGTGRADLVNKLTNEIFEIKPASNQQAINSGLNEIASYITNANIHCPYNPATIPPGWQAGNAYPIRFLPCKVPGKVLKAELKYNGVVSTGLILYSYQDIGNGPSPVPVVVPETIADKIKNLVERIRQNVSDAERIIAEYLHEHPDLVTYFKAAAIVAAAGIIVATILEDIGTAGWGILDDLESFLLAYKIVRFAWAL
jgi:hypothetical protein